MALQKRNPNPFYSILISFLFLCFLFVTLESVTRLAVPDNQLEKILAILKQDPVLFWRQKPNLKVMFQGVEVHTDQLGLRNKKLNQYKPDGSLRIICMGASPTFGWGIRYEDTYPCQLEKMLKNDLKQRVEVINAGVIGYSSYQGLNFFRKEIIPFQPDIITVSYVLNDVDKYRFYRSNGDSDNELYPKNPFLISLKNTFDKSKFLRLFEKTILYLQYKMAGFFNNKRNVFYQSKPRVSSQEYRKNLQDIIELAKRKRIKVLFVKIPVNLPLPSGLSQSSRLNAEKHLNAGLAYLMSGRYEQAKEIFNEALKENPYLSEACYYLGICFEKTRKIKDAKLCFQQAREKEVYRCGEDGRLYNRIMEEVAQENNILLVDIVSAFNKNNNTYLFLDPARDPIHPNAIGHKIIASKIYEALR